MSRYILHRAKHLNEIKQAETVGTTSFIVHRISVGEGQAVTVDVTARAYKSDLTAALAYEVVNGFRRAVGGNVTAVNTATVLVNLTDSGGAPAVTLVANTATQTVDVTVTGVVAETWEWDVQITALY